MIPPTGAPTGSTLPTAGVETIGDRGIARAARLRWRAQPFRSQVVACDIVRRDAVSPAGSFRADVATSCADLNWDGLRPLPPLMIDTWRKPDHAPR